MADDAPKRRAISKLLLQHGEVGDNPALVGSFLREERKLARKIKTLDANRKYSMSHMDNEINHIRRTFLHDQQLSDNSIVDLSMSLIPEDGSNLSNFENIFDGDKRRKQDTCDQKCASKNSVGKNKAKISRSTLQNLPGDFQEVHVANFIDNHLSFSHHQAHHFRHSHRYFNDGRSRGKYDSLNDEKDCSNGRLLASKDALNFSTAHNNNIHEYASDAFEETATNARSCMLRKPRSQRLNNESASHLFSPDDVIKSKNRRSFSSSADIRKEASPTASLSNMMKPARQRSWSDSQVFNKESKPPLIDLNVNDLTKTNLHLPIFVRKSNLLHRDKGLQAGHSHVFPDANMRLRPYHSTKYTLNSLPTQNIRSRQSTINNVNPMLFHPRFNNVSDFPLDEDINSFEALKKCRYLRVPQRHLSPDIDGMAELHY